MQGTQTVPFSTLVADTIQTHGYAWAKNHYCNPKKANCLSELEWHVFAFPFHPK